MAETCSENHHPQQHYLIKSHTNSVTRPRFRLSSKHCAKKQFLTKKCSEGLGKEKFAKALDLLTKMQEGDCKVEVDGAVYDGNDDDDVSFRLDVCGSVFSSLRLCCGTGQLSFALTSALC